jgi:REP element-mobilizing transposase RayT
MSGGKYKNKYRIESMRLKNWDYANDGMYFITICTKDREFFFGDCINGKIKLSTIGKLADQYWREITKHFPRIELDEYVVMPNHVHGIIIIDNSASVPETASASETAFVETRHGASLPPASPQPLEFPKPPASQRTLNGGLATNDDKSASVETRHGASLQPGEKRRFGPLQKQSLSLIINHYKGAVKTRCNKNKIDFAWQPRFYDQIIRNEKSLMKIREYIRNNPFKWNLDRNNLCKDAPWRV